MPRRSCTSRKNRVTALTHCRGVGRLSSEQEGASCVTDSGDMLDPACCIFVLFAGSSYATVLCRPIFSSEDDRLLCARAIQCT